MRLLLIACALLVCSPAVHAGDDLVTVRTSGRARTDAADPRTEMLDDAFRAAVRQVTAPMVKGRVSSTQRAAINRDIYRRARRFVKSFRVDSSRTLEGHSELTVNSVIRRGLIRAVLAEIGVGGAGGDSGGATPSGTGGSRPSVVAVMHWQGPSGARPAADMNALARRAIGELGFQVAAGDKPPASSSAASELPLTDLEAAEFARSSSAGGVFVVGVRSRADGGIRATRLVGGVATAKIRVVDSSGKLVAKASASAAGYGSDGASAEARAGDEALRRALISLRRSVDRHWPPVKLSKTGVVASIDGLRSHSSLRAIERHLAASRSAIRVTRIRMSQGLVQLTLESKLSPSRLAAIIRSTPARSAAISARAKGKTIEVRVRDYAGGGS